MHLEVSTQFWGLARVMTPSGAIHLLQHIRTPRVQMLRRSNRCGCKSKRPRKRCCKMESERGETTRWCRRCCLQREDLIILGDGGKRLRNLVANTGMLI